MTKSAGGGFKKDFGTGIQVAGASVLDCLGFVASNAQELIEMRDFKTQLG